MLLQSILPRVFLHKVDGREIRLDDPNSKLSPQAIMDFYAGTYPILTNARLVGPEIKRDEVIFRFESTMGTKG